MVSMNDLVSKGTQRQIDRNFLNPPRINQQVQQSSIVTMDTKYSDLIQISQGFDAAGSLNKQNKKSSKHDIDPFMMVTMQEGYDPAAKYKALMNKAQMSTLPTNNMPLIPQPQLKPVQPAIISKESTVVKRVIGSDRDRAALVPAVLKLKKIDK